MIAHLDTPYDIGILYQKLQDANFQTWNADEQNAVNEFSVALWAFLLFDNSKKAEWEFKDYFTALAHFHTNFNDLTELWMSNTSFSSIKHLTNYIFDEAYDLFTKRHNKGDEKNIKNTEAFKTWLLSDKLNQKLTDAFYQYEETDLAEKISMVIKILEDENQNTQRTNRTL